MSWFVFTDRELDEIADAGFSQFADTLRNRGTRTGDDTILVRTEGREAVILTGSFGKYPRRMARDPPTDTRPSGTKLNGRA